jgi:hypothetical protein
MVFHGALADAKIRGDVLAGVAGENQLHDLTLPRCEARDAIRRIRPMTEELVHCLMLTNQLVVLMAQGLFPRESLS